MNKLPLPFDNDTFDEIHAYEVLEHVGKQGDYIFFFAQFSDLYRILKPNGLLVAMSPSIHRYFKIIIINKKSMIN